MQHQLRTDSTVSVVDVSISKLKTSPGAHFSAQDWGMGKCDAQPPPNQALRKTLHQTDLEMSRTAERSQGFHDLWPHTPKLNTRNTQSRNEKMRDS